MNCLRGSDVDGMYPMLVVHNYLAAQAIARPGVCILAVTIMCRNNKRDANLRRNGVSMSQKDMFTIQMRSLIGIHGFAYHPENELIFQYSRQCCLGLWVLFQDTSVSEHIPLLRYKHSRRIIGFPPIK